MPLNNHKSQGDYTVYNSYQTYELYTLYLICGYLLLNITKTLYFTTEFSYGLQEGLEKSCVMLQIHYKSAIHHSREVEQNVTTWNTLLPLFPALTVPSTQHLVA